MIDEQGKEEPLLFGGKYPKEKPVQVMMVQDEPETDDGISCDSDKPEAPPVQTLETEFIPAPPIAALDPLWEQLRKTRDPLLPFLTVEEMDALRGIVVSNLSAFAKDKYDLGCTQMIEHKVDLVQGAKPHKETLRRLNSEKQRQADQQVQALLELGVIEPAQSPLASGIAMAKKKDPNTLRMCIDFRMLNEQTIGDAYPLPRIDDTVTGLGSARIFTSIDISKALWQLILRAADRYKTACATKTGLYQWTRMPFGLCNATATFQRLMNTILGDIKQEYGDVVLCHVDDILIVSITVEQHLRRLDEVFRKLGAASLKCEPSKCSFMKTKISFLGRSIGEYEVKPHPEMYKTLM